MKVDASATEKKSFPRGFSSRERDGATGEAMAVTARGSTALHGLGYGTSRCSRLLW